MHTTTPPSGEGSHSGRASRTPAWSHLFLPVHRWLYRRTGGAIGHHLGIQRTLLLTTTGRHSGQPRTQPLAYFTQEGQTFVVASNWGNDRPPAWYLNLQAEPRVQVQLGRRIFDATAAIASPEERSRLWPRLIARSPNFARYQELAAREIPLVLLHPEPSAR
ncbi:MAG TPA: nitroreductase family deazaflavin-dependent oxidoreductase [Ktedonobacterales bacterium]|nr:nitroreductase family deazaflavin-dependent oxidoreductase [Ktedonobacterales bacterium]